MSVPEQERYRGAWAEMSTRIQARQAVGTQFVTITWIVLGLVFTKPDAIWAAWLGMLLPVLALVFALWICHHDATIGLLSKFCYHCETWPDIHVSQVTPSWHSPSQGWMTKALRYRLYADTAFIVAFLATCIPSALRAGSMFEDSFWQGIGYVVLASFGLAAAGLILHNRTLRRRIKDHFELTKGHNGDLIAMFTDADH